jgi:ribonuclease Z
VSGRDLVILGTSSGPPTRDRNHNGYLLRWDQEAILIDPGEGTQRQLARAGVSPHHVTHICLTHLHGDHCLGLPGVLEQLVLDGIDHEVTIHFPASGLAYVERLCHACVGPRPMIRLDPIDPGPDAGAVLVDAGPPLRITTRRLVHPVEAIGWRFEEPERRHLVPALLARAGIRGAAVGRLERDGFLDVDGSRITFDAMSELRPGSRAAVVMDTSLCDAALALADQVDVLLCEATFLESEADLARDTGHLTARQAATIARRAGAGLLVLTHFSGRYRDAEGHRREASSVFPDVICAEDLQVVAFPPHPRELRGSGPTSPRPDARRPNARS